MVLRHCLTVGAALLLLFASGHAASALCVRGVDSRDTLRMRTGPTAIAREIGHIAPFACGIVIIGTCRGPWCPVQWRGRTGWSNTAYLVRGGLPELFNSPQQFMPSPPIQAHRDALPRASASSQNERVASQRTDRVTTPAVARRGRTPSIAAPQPPPRVNPVPPHPVLSAPLPPATAAPTTDLPTLPSFVPPATAGPAASPTLAPVPAPATPTKSDLPGDTCVVEIPKGDTLRVRAGPSLDQALRYGYPAGVCGVRITGPCANGWCPVDYRGYRGWAEQRFLK